MVNDGSKTTRKRRLKKQESGSKNTGLILFLNSHLQGDYPYWFVAIGLSVAMFFVVEIFKFFYSMRRGGKWLLHSAH